LGIIIFEKIKRFSQKKMWAGAYNYYRQRWGVSQVDSPKKHSFLAETLV